MRLSEYIRKTLVELEDDGVTAIHFDLIVAPEGDEVKVITSLNEPTASKVRFWVKRPAKKK